MKTALKYDDFEWVCGDMPERVLVGIAAYARAYMDILGDGWEPETEAQLEAAFRRVGKALGDERMLSILWNVDKLSIITALVEARERGAMR